jgi:CRISPR-associated protein Cmr2
MDQEIPPSSGGDWMVNNMLVFTIGPVQPFIAQARKTRDLWMGSFLLSKLMEVALEELPGKLIFPAHRTITPPIPDLPNKFVALYETPEKAEQAASGAISAMGKWWRDDLADKIWQRLSNEPYQNTLLDTDTDTIWKRQAPFASYFEVYWVVVTRQDSDASYGAWYYRAQQALDARKRLRGFAQQIESGEKSTISGEREALRNRPEPGETLLQATQRFWSILGKHFSDAQITQQGRERLDAIDTIKRFAAPLLVPKGQAFPSTSTLAAAPFIGAILQSVPKLHDELAAWKQATEKLAWSAQTALPYLEQRAREHEDVLLRDGDAFFLETFTSKRLQENYPLMQAEAQEVAKLGLDAVKKMRQAAAREVKIDPPSPYYAVLTMDGDQMGTMLSRIEKDAEHSNLSQALSTFSREKVRQKVEREQFAGKLVYAGGDDVLALVSMRHALPLANAIQETFRKEIRPFRPEGYAEDRVTMSAGIAIAHYLDPLSHVLREARLAENAAKERYGRDSVVVTLLRRSGESTMVGSRWTYPNLDKDSQPLTLFSNVAFLLEEQVLSTNFVYALAEEASTLSRLPQPAQESEIGRLLTRGCSSDKEKRDFLSKDAIKALANQIAGLAAAMNMKPDAQGEYREVELWRPGPRRGLVEISGWFLLMSFSLRGGAD